MRSLPEGAIHLSSEASCGSSILSLNMRQDTQNGSEDEIDILNANGQLLTKRHEYTNENQKNSTFQTNTVFPSNNLQQSWFHPVQDAAWSLPVAPTRPDKISPGALSDVGLGEIAMDPSERGHGQGEYFSAAFEDTYFFSPLINESQVDQLFSPFLHDLN